MDHRAEEAHAALDNRSALQLKLVAAEAEGRTTALRSRLTTAEQREKAAVAALISVQVEPASTRAELLPLQQRATAIESLVQQSREEAICR